MASVVNETESGIALVMSAGLFLLLFYLLGGIDFLRGVATGGEDAAGVMQSIRNAANGFPDGADPGTIPAFQIMQGIMESLRNLTNLHLTQDPQDPGSATAAEQMQALAEYQPPGDEQAKQTYTAIPAAVGNFFQTAETNPGALPFF